jgi:polyhydroxybutyrate depolymerase
MTKTVACMTLLVLMLATGCATKFKSAPGQMTAGAVNGAPGTGGAASMIGAGSGGATGAAAGGNVGSGGAAPMGGAVGSGGSGDTSNPNAIAGNGSMPPADGGSMPGTDQGAVADAGSMSTPVTCPASSVLQPGDTSDTIDVGGRTRNYIVHVPAGYTGQAPVPLVTDWHGILFNNGIEQSFSGWQQKADKEGFIVVFPDGVDTAWNVGWCCTSDKTVDDVAFARALVAKLEQQACIDPKRVYAVGYSMGGGMSMKLACDASDLIAAIAPAAFDLMTENEWPCQPSRPITIIQFRSTGDPIVPYEGGATSPPNGLPITVDFLGAEANFTKWSQLDGCTGEPAMGSNGCRTYSQCQAGAEVTLCTTQGGSHDYGDPEIAWEMLKKHPLP